MVKNFFKISIVIFFSVVAGFSLLHKGLPPTHDGEYHVVRFYEFGKAIFGGNWYPRWTQDLNNGFGVPLFNFVYPLPNYVAVVFHAFGISFIDSFKYEMFIALILSALFCYLWAKEFWGSLGGIVSSVFYTFAPYHFVDIYIRGSVGEVWAITFFPGFLWVYSIFAKTKNFLYFVLSSIFLFLIVFSHNILALMFLFFILFYIVFLVFNDKNKKFLALNSLYIILTGLGLSAIFWLPALFETKYVTGLQIFDVASHFPELYQLLIPSWGSGFSGVGLGNEISYQIGIANLFVIFLGIITILMKRKNIHKRYVIFFILSFFFVLFLMLSISSFVWKTIPFMNYFQFPWRFLSLEMLLCSFLAGGISSIKSWIRFPLAIFLILLSFLLGIGYMKPAHYFYREDNYYFTKPNFVDGTNSPGNSFNTIYFNTSLNRVKEKARFLKGGGNIVFQKSKNNIYLFEAIADKDSQILMNIAYFPGWQVSIDQNKEETQITNDGLFTFFVPKGKHNIKVYFGNTLVRRIAIFFSFLSIGIIVFLFAKARSVTIKR